jgi:hypothetical protein
MMSAMNPHADTTAGRRGSQEVSPEASINLTPISGWNCRFERPRARRTLTMPQFH